MDKFLFTGENSVISPSGNQSKQETDGSKLGISVV